MKRTLIIAALLVFLVFPLAGCEAIQTGRIPTTPEQRQQIGEARDTAEDVLVRAQAMIAEIKGLEIITPERAEQLIRLAMIAERAEADIDRYEQILTDAEGIAIGDLAREAAPYAELVPVAGPWIGLALTALAGFFGVSASKQKRKADGLVKGSKDLVYAFEAIEHGDDHDTKDAWRKVKAKVNHSEDARRIVEAAKGRGGKL